MTHEEIKAALHAACQEHLNKSFGVLVDNLITESPDTAAKQFEVNCCKTRQAYTIALSSIEKVFAGQ